MSDHKDPVEIFALDGEERVAMSGSVWLRRYELQKFIAANRDLGLTFWDSEHLLERADPIHVVLRMVYESAPIHRTIAFRFL